MSKSMLLVLTNPVPGKEAEFEAWYEQQHVPEVLDIPGYVAASRWKKSHLVWPSGRPSVDQSRAALYTVEGDLEAAINALTSRVADGTIVLPDCIDIETIGITPYEFISDTN